jgi:hypothetical protein
VPVEELELDAQRLLEALASLVDVVVAPARAMEFAAGGSFSDAQGWADRSCNVTARRRSCLMGEPSLAAANPSTSGD